jgi:hypothetical protein
MKRGNLVMTLPTPQNPEEASYLAIATVRELLNLLITKGVISEDDITAMLRLAAERLKEENNYGSQRAARFLAEWMGG